MPSSHWLISCLLPAAGSLAPGINRCFSICIVKRSGGCYFHLSSKYLSCIHTPKSNLSFARQTAINSTTSYNILTFLELMVNALGKAFFLWQVCAYISSLKVYPRNIGTFSSLHSRRWMLTVVKLCWSNNIRPWRPPRGASFSSKSALFSYSSILYCCVPGV